MPRLLWLHTCTSLGLFTTIQWCQVSERGRWPTDLPPGQLATSIPQPTDLNSSLKMWHASTDTPPPSKKAFGLTRCGGGLGGTQVRLAYKLRLFWVLNSSHGNNSVWAIYMVVRQVVHYVLLTSKWELHFSIRRIYCFGTFVLMSTKSSVQPADIGLPTQEIERN